MRHGISYIVLAVLAATAFTTGARPSPPVTNSMVLSELINDHAPYPSSHASTIAETTDRQLAGAWFGGTGEGHPDVGIWFARKGPHGWEPSVEVANGQQPDGTREPAWNPVLFQAPNGPLFLFYKVGTNGRSWWGMVTTTTDDGHTWTKPRRLSDGIIGPMKDKPVVLPDGAWLSGSDSEDAAGWRVHFELSHDAGQTWNSVGPIDRGAGFDAIQPTILFPGHGRIEALCRTKQGVIAMTWSSDGGRSWTPLAATSLPNPNSGIDAVTLADGRLLVAYNHSAHLPGFPGHGNRYPLDVAMSRDGLTWTHALTVEDEPQRPNLANRPAIDLSPPTLAQKLEIWGGKGFSYPAVIQTSDGFVHITYTVDRRVIKHVVLDPRRLQ
jgi:predicted neuraminidase